MSSLLKKTIASFVLLSFLIIVFFSFVVMMHEPNGGMSKNCLFSTVDVSLCPQDALVMVFHHISSYQSFINIPIDFGISILVIFLLFVLYTILTTFINSSQFKLVSIGISYSPPQETSHERKIARWVALHENSPTIF
ncbi:MAG: hypothetical protein Athens071416_109 [Parcubacteria group bacterium Athens0714_16]|nr:MAG: hypothetical protein Athens071416_109 [Parcubacteria group bacterium Athens0714_16]